jgi:hypothetical protein
MPNIQSVVALKCFITIDDGYIHGNHNFILGNDNIISGKDNIVVGYGNRFLDRDGTQNNFEYNVPVGNFRVYAGITDLFEKVTSFLEGTPDWFLKRKEFLLRYILEMDRDCKTDLLNLLRTPAPNEERLRSLRDTPYRSRMAPTLARDRRPPTSLIPTTRLLSWLRMYCESNLSTLNRKMDKADNFNWNAATRYHESHDTPPTRGPSLEQSLFGFLLGDILLRGSANSSAIYIRELNREMDLPGARGNQLAPPPPSMLPDPIENEPSAGPQEKVCIICTDRAVNTAVVPCGHRYSCVTCFHNDLVQGKCAVCRKPFTQIIRTYDHFVESTPSTVSTTSGAVNEKD